MQWRLEDAETYLEFQPNIYDRTLAKIVDVVDSKYSSEMQFCKPNLH